jgi:2-oxoglutarate ferredoxin oxidoreductase subunit beta
MRDNMLPYYPLGVYKDVKAAGFANVVQAAAAHAADLAAGPATPAEGGEA